MDERFFSYNPVKKSWQETDCPELSVALAEKLPQIFLIEDNEQLVWCPLHHTYEKVEGLEVNEASTADGCTLRGTIISMGSCDISKDEPSMRDSFDIRWHINQERLQSRWMIGVDRIMVGMGNGFDKRRGKVLVPHVYERSFHSLSLNYAKEKMIETGDCRKIPVEVLAAALSDLQGLAEDYYGEKMPFSWERIAPCDQYSGRECIEAVVHYPFAPMLWPIRKYFNSNEKSRIFPRDHRDSFSEICATHGVDGGKEFFLSILQNPQALLTNIRLRKLGFRKEKNIAIFYDLTNFCGKEKDSRLEGEIFTWGNNSFSYDTSIFQDDDAMVAFRKDKRYTLDDWEALFFYCQWNLSQKNEDVFAPMLYRLLAQWQPCYAATLRSIQHDYLRLPKKIRQRILEQGLSPQICFDIQETLKNQQRRIANIPYSKKELSYEGHVDRYEFRLLKSGEDYKETRRNIGSGGYYEAQPAVCAGMLLVGIYENNRAVACFMLIQGILEEFYPECFLKPTLKDARLHIAFLHWLEQTGLREEFCNLYEDDLSYLKDICPNEEV